jgi:predicted molibdopterin-dependent oxidoreductase YjgC
VQISPRLAEEMGVSDGTMLALHQQGGIDTTLPVKINKGLVHRTVLLPVGIRETAGLGDAFATISLSRA